MSTLKSIVLLFFILSLNACRPVPEQEQFLIGFAQCTQGDAWREAMVSEMRREMAFHPELRLEIKDARNSSALQKEQIRAFVKEGVDLLIVSPNQAAPITPVVEEAFEQGIPVIIVDRRTNSTRYTAYVGADNYEIGQLAGEYVAKFLNGKGNIAEVWGLEGSSPAIDRHRGFVEALSDYPQVSIIGKIAGEWEKDTARQRAAANDSVLAKADLVFAHNDMMALGVYEHLQSMGRAKGHAFVGIDGLGGPKGGMQLVEDGVLDATFLYPTGGEETIQLASKILHNQPYNKENMLQSTVIDGSNVRIMQLQANKLMTQQKSIERQQSKLAEQLDLYQNQRILLIILSASLAIGIILAALALLALRQKLEANKKLEAKNAEILHQRNEVARMARKADKATEAKFKFFTNISHEFRTPLTLILGPVEDILRRDIPPEGRRDLLLVRKNAIRLLNLVNQLMDFRKIEHQKMRLRAGERDIVGFLRDIASSFESLAKKKHIRLRVDTDLEQVPVYFDADKIDKVFFNLLSNSFKFTGEGGFIRINVALSERHDQVQIVVEDSGRGMSPEHVAHAFDRFYTGEAYNNVGTGLGLSLSKEFIDMHKGAISVVSEKWKGTKFVVLLPLGKGHLTEEEIVTDLDAYVLDPSQHLLEEEQDEAAADAAVTQGVGPREHTLLLIEDNKELRQFLKKRLLADYTIVEASDGKAGLEKAFETVPDLIICDVMLPGKTGLQVTTTLKNDVRTSHIPIVLLTAKDSLEHKIDGVQAGADLYITKPFSYHYLHERVKNLLLNRQKLREHYTHEIPVETKSVPRQLDKKFINEFMAAVEQHLSDPNLNANDIATHLGLSRVQVYRKVKALLGFTVNEYVVKVRLKKAKHLLLHSDLNISEIAFEVGFSSPAYFSTAFKNHFNISPSEYKASRTSQV